MRALIVAVLLLAAPVHAARVAVRPFRDAPDRLALVAQPVADAVARALAGRGVDASAGKDAVGALIVELRLRPVGARVALEAVVLEGAVDAAATELGRVSTRPLAPAKLDALATELGRALVPVIAVAAERLAATRPPPPLVPAILPATTATTATTTTTDPLPLPTPAPAIAPTLAFALPHGVVPFGGRMVDIGPPALRAVAAWSRRAEVSITTLIERGLLGPAAAAQGAAGAGARATLLLRVSELELVPRGVLTGRGSVELLVVGVDGKLRLRRMVESSTLVVGRGEGVEELLIALVSQALDAEGRAVRAALVGP